MKVGLVCPYPWDVPGGVMAHVRDLAEELIALGHSVSVLAPVDDDDAPLPPYLVPAGGSVPVPFNGSVARLAFGPLIATRVRRWIRDGHFDVLHVHSPEAPSLSLLAMLHARGPIVATFHAANPRSRLFAAMSGVFQSQVEKMHGRIAVSADARKTIVEHLGGDAVVIPNGVSVRSFAGAEPWPRHGGELVGFLGRLDEPRKGLAVLLDAFAVLGPSRPQLRLLLAGPGDARALLSRRLPGELHPRVELLGRLSEPDKARFFATLDAYVAPNVGGESFGIVLLEAMAGCCPVVASDLPAFRQVLAGGAGGRLFRTGDGRALATVLGDLLDEPAARAHLVSMGQRVVGQYDWPEVVRRIVAVYETVLADAGDVLGSVEATEEEPPAVLPGPVSMQPVRGPDSLDLVVRPPEQSRAAQPVAPLDVVDG